MHLRINTFALVKKEMGHKRGQGKSMMHAYMCCGRRKGTCRAQAMSNSEEFKSIVVTIVELHWSEGIS